MIPLEISPATIVVGLAIAACIVLAVRRLVRRGTCDCHDGCGSSGGGCAGCSGCSGCGAADKMVADLQKQAAEAQR